MTSGWCPNPNITSFPNSDNYNGIALITCVGGNTTTLLQHCCNSTSPAVIVQFGDQLQYCPANATDCNAATACLHAVAPGLPFACLGKATSAALSRPKMNFKTIAAIVVLALAWATL